MGVIMSVLTQAIDKRGQQVSGMLRFIVLRPSDSCLVCDLVVATPVQQSRV